MSETQTVYGDPEPAKPPSERLSSEVLNRTGEALRNHRLRGLTGFRSWDKIEESDREVYRNEVRVMVDALGDGT